MKKILCMTLALLMVCSMLPVSVFANDSLSREAQSVWDGSVASSFGGGEGSEADPYLISNGAELAYLSKCMSGGSRFAGIYFKLTDDIYLNDLSDYSSWGTTAPANSFATMGASNMASFGGHLNGNGHTIYGLYNGGSDVFKGLFYSLSGSVKALRLEKAYLTASEKTMFCGGIAAVASAGSLLEECFVGGTLASGGTVGSLVGMADSGSEIRNCYATASLESGTILGGLVGELNGTMKNCYFSGTIHEDTCAALAVNGQGTITNGYYLSTWDKSDEIWSDDYMNGLNGHEEPPYLASDFNLAREGTSLTAAKMKQAGSFVGFDFETVWTMEGNETYLYPELQSHQPPVVEKEGSVWSGLVASSFAGGDGSEANPYLISNGAELAYLSKRVSEGNLFADTYFKLTSDIYLNDLLTYDDWGTTPPANSFSAIGITFGGHLDGDGYTIYGLYNGSNDAAKGLFNNLSGSVKALRLERVYFAASETDAACGGIAANALAGSLIEECFVEGRLASGGKLGSLVGIASVGSEIRNCYATAILESGNPASGLVGGLNGTLKNSYFSGSIYKDPCAALTYGGNGTITNSYYLSTWDKSPEIWSPDFMDGLDGRIDPPYMASDYSLARAGTSLTAAKMKLASSFVGFDFENVWTMDGSASYLYPELRSHQVKEAHEHSWNFGTVTLPPTETQSGTIKYACYICGEARTETVNAYGLLKNHLCKTLDGFDYFGDGKLNVSYMTETVNGYFTDETNTSDKPAVVAARRYEDALRKHFDIDDAILAELHRSDAYDAVTETYSLTYIGGKGGKGLRERHYLGYVANEDGSYTVYYRTVPYRYLEDVLTDNYTNMDDADITFNGDETVEYKGVVYINSEDGYYTISDEMTYSGKKYTVDLIGDTVRILASADYKMSDIPKTFTDVIFHIHDWNYGDVTEQPTETEPGEIEYTCYFCGETKTELLTALGPLEDLFRGGIIYSIDYNEDPLPHAKSILMSEFTNISNTREKPAIVPAKKVQDVLGQYLVVDERLLSHLDWWSYGSYDAETETYLLMGPDGRGSMGWYDREYFGYTKNEDGTYDVYYRTIPYQFLKNVLPEGTSVSDVVGEGSPRYVLYRGIVYYNDGFGDYVTVLPGAENRGNKHTVELNGNTVRWLSMTSYGEVDLPASFDHSEFHQHTYRLDGSTATCTKPGYLIGRCSCGCATVLEEVAATHTWGKWKETDTPNTYVSQCTLCDATETITLPKVNTTDPQTNAGNADLANTDAELINSVLTDLDRFLMVNGQSVSVWLDVNEIAETDLSDERKTAIANGIRDLAPESDAPAVCFDMKLFNKVGDRAETAAYGTTKVSIAVPEEWLGGPVGRVYKVMTVYGDRVSSAIDGVFDEETKTFTFETAGYGYTYALTYVDPVLDVNQNGLLTVDDLIELIKILPAETQPFYFDYNGDSVVDILDVLYLATQIQ